MDEATSVPLRAVNIYAEILRRLFCLPLILGFASSCFAQQQSFPDADARFTADILKITLYARTVDERKFCDYVIEKRDDGTIPHQIIYFVYRKAMTQDRYRRFAYFKLVLEIVCQREGIALYSTQTQTSSGKPPWLPSLFSGRF